MDVPADLNSALDRLVGRGVLDRGQAAAVLAEMAGTGGDATRQPRLRRLLGEIAGYVGAGFLAGATLLFLGDRWDVLGTAGRFAILAGVAAVLFGSGLVARLRRPAGDHARRRLASTMLTGAAAAAGFAATVLGGDPLPAASPLAGASTALVVVLAGYRLAPTAFGQLGVAAAVVASYAALLELLDVTGSVQLGAGMIGLGAVWAVAVWRRLVLERRFGCAVSVLLALAGAQTAAVDLPMTGYALTALVATAAFTAYGRIRDWIPLAAGVAATTLVVPEFLFEVTDGALGASGIMLVAGVTLLAGSLAALRLRAAGLPSHPG